MWDSCLEMAHAQASLIPVRSPIGILIGGSLTGNPFLEVQIATELIMGIGRDGGRNNAPKYVEQRNRRASIGRRCSVQMTFELWSIGRKYVEHWAFLYQ